MTLSRARWILTGLIAVLAALQAHRADAAFVRVQDPSLLLGERSKLYFPTGAFDVEESSLAGASAPEFPVRSPSGPPDENDSRRVVQERFARPCEDSPAQGANSTPQSHGTGPTNAAAPSANTELPQITLITRLPSDMGPAFCNPPPWAPLRPPRVAI